MYENLAPLKAEADASPEVLSVLSQMAANGDLDKLSDVLDLYSEMADGDQQTVGVTVTTAVPLDHELRALITQKCELDLGCNVFLIERVDPSIIGGLILPPRPPSRCVGAPSTRAGRQGHDSKRNEFGGIATCPRQSMPRTSKRS